ncbi:hypothetical protein RRG08_065443 [Elysia crispata]|uniref:Secreted protein n=1 Tax=Elysia crispata TaxID=231223 RepID=A0AAE0YJL4_9GAST|nr:hypothetical protein RRG08_065443 [Elysia crispata]
MRFYSQCHVSCLLCFAVGDIFDLTLCEPLLSRVLDDIACQIHGPRSSSSSRISTPVMREQPRNSPSCPPMFPSSLLQLQAGSSQSAVYSRCAAGGTKWSWSRQTCPCPG